MRGERQRTDDTVPTQVHLETVLSQRLPPPSSPPWRPRGSFHAGPTPTRLRFGVAQSPRRGGNPAQRECRRGDDAVLERRPAATDTSANA